jgi:hypothetical protein
MFSNKTCDIGRKVNLIHHHYVKYDKESYLKIKHYILYILKYKIHDDECDHLYNVNKELDEYMLEVRDLKTYSV